MRGGSIGVLVATACSITEPSLERFPCEEQQCIEGFVCHPETDECVLPVDASCDGEGLCPSSVADGDPCTSAGSFLPCEDGRTDCDGGCRTCSDDGAWTACSTGCGELGQQTQCGSCTEDCTDLPNVELATCELSGPGFGCRVIRCDEPFIDARSDEAGCECQETNDGIEICDGVDNDCDGEVDDFGALGAIRLSCEALFPAATNVDGWVCEGACVADECQTGFHEVDGDPANGCEYCCTPSGTEVCDGVDNDCNGVIDDVPEAELNAACESLFPEARAVTVWSCVSTADPGQECVDRSSSLGTGACAIGTCRSGGYFDEDGDITTGCEAGCVPTADPTEICDDEDNDCDGIFDNEGADGCTVYYRDDDGDGTGLAEDSQCLCLPEPPYTAIVPGDCDDDPEGCGDDCFPGNSTADTCNGEDNNCSGADGENDPQLGRACDGIDADACEDDEFIGCFAGELFCGEPCERAGDGSCVASSPIAGCFFGDASCSGGMDNVLDCASAADDDCDGAIGCQDFDCRNQAGCGELTDNDGDGRSDVTDCDNRIPNCTDDCTTNRDSIAESTPVVDCVEEYCGSLPLNANSRCRVVSSASELEAALIEASANDGASTPAAQRDFVLVAADVTVPESMTLPPIAGPIELRQAIGTTITREGDGPLFVSAGTGSVLENLDVVIAGSGATGLEISGGSTVLRNVRVRVTGAIGGAVIELTGERGTLESVTVEVASSAAVGIRVTGASAVLDRTVVTDSTPAGGGLGTGIEIAVASGSVVRNSQVGVFGDGTTGYEARGLYVHGDGGCAASSSTPSRGVGLINNRIFGGRAGSGAEVAGILLCGVESARVVGNIIAAGAHDGLKLRGVTGESRFDHNSIADNGGDAIEFLGEPSTGVCLRQNVLVGNSGADVRSSIFDIGWSAQCPTDTAFSASLGTIECRGECGDCGCLPDGDSGTLFVELGADPFTSRVLTAPNAFCPVVPSEIVDAGVDLSGGDATLAPSYDRNGSAFGLSTDAPDLGALESSTGDCP
ncbi:MAG: right-handed parallel beta-helix repeat-containing protein [Myxococcota bacterium]